MADNVTPIRNPTEPRPAARFPMTVEEKIIVAKSIVMAVVAADQSGNLNEENYDQCWPLKMATELLDQAADQIDQERLAER